MAYPNEIVRVSVTPTITLDAYTANDVVGGLMTFSGVGGSGGGGFIRSVLVVDDADQSEPYTLYIFNDEPSAIDDDAAFAPTVADLGKLVTTVDVAAGDYTSVNSSGWALLGGHEDAAMEVAFYGPTLYMYAVAGDTPDYASADDLRFTITVEKV